MLFVSILKQTKRLKPFSIECREILPVPIFKRNNFQFPDAFVFCHFTKGVEKLLRVALQR